MSDKTIYVLVEGKKIKEEGDVIKCWLTMLIEYRDVTIKHLIDHNIRIVPKS